MNLADFGAGDSPALREAIAARIRDTGPMSFAEFYRLAMYHPEHGYYVCCDPTDDYQSSPNVHAVFGAALARQIADLWRLMGQPDGFTVFEAAAGSGRLAADILLALRVEAPELHASLRYVVQDETYVHVDAQRLLERTGVPMDRIEVATSLPVPGSIEGIILSNELLDAIPFERVVVRNGTLRRLMTGIEGSRFIDIEADPTPELAGYFEALGLLPGEGSFAEAGLESLDWYGRAAAALRRGYILTLDYGYEAEALYAPWRKRGTLLSFYRHTSGDDPYVRIGRQDLTASIDFTSVRRTGEAAGLTTLGIATQTDFLAALGIGEALQQSPAPEHLEAFYALRRGVMELIDPSGLGRIRFLIQSRDVPEATPLGLRPTGRG